jgi:RHS repeat-associated protein
MIASELKYESLLPALLMAAAVAIGMPMAANAQDTGYSVNVCSSGTIDSNYYNDYVEQTVCLSGDASGLDAYNEVDLEQYQEEVVIQLVGADAQIYGSSGLVADSGEQQGSYVTVNAWVSSPQTGVWYSMYGLYDECQDPGADGWINCGWTGLMSGYSVSAMVTTPPTPSLSVSTSGTPSYPGQTVTFTATISSGPQGSIYFYDGNSYIGSGAINATTATVTDSNLALGNHSITAVWQGNSSYQPNASGPITQVVSQIVPTLTLGTSGTPTGYGQSVTFTATISSGPQGSLTFYDQGVSIGTAAISGTTATLTTSSLSSGTHSITASWGGDSIYAAASSGAITQIVNAPPVMYSYSITGYAPNGNLLNYTDTVNGTWSIPSTGGYDGLNRLSAATWTPVGGTQQSACWSYDSFGNRTAQVVQSATCSDPAPTASYNSNNQVTWVQGSALGFEYDAAGNVVTDNLNRYRYDAEGRLCAVQNQFSLSNTGYLYDASGARVAKGTLTSFDCGAAMSSVEIYVLGPSNEQVSEIDSQGNWKHTNIFAGGTLIGTYDVPTNNTLFVLTDWLGTKRVEVGSGVNPCVTAYSNLPFGDGSAPASVSTYSQCPEDATEHHFTGKERDDESGNDYFGARYYASSMGRFMSPDWSAKEDPVPYAKLADPQTLNLYTYVGNNPLTAIDADGHGMSDFMQSVWDGTLYQAGLNLAQDEMLYARRVKAEQKAQQQYGRQADGSYKADPADVQAAIKAGKPILEPGNPDHKSECVFACKALSQMKNIGTSQWRKGKAAVGLNDTTDIGLAIATLGSGTYPSQRGNSGIYMGHDANGGIKIVDQWPNNGPQYNHPFEHTLTRHDEGPDMDPNAYFVIIVPKP